MIKINVLGVEYSVIETNEKTDEHLKKCDGYCDKTTKRIVVIGKSEDSDLGDFEVYKRKILRHEIIHAFLFESGLHENWTHPEYGHDETYVDWVATQFPKLMQAFKKCNCID